MLYTERLYRSEFAPTQNGECGITLNVNWAEPRDINNPMDVTAATTHLQFNLGWYAHPILKDGKYPPIMRAKIDDKSAKQGTGKCDLFRMLFVLFSISQRTPTLAYNVL